MITQYTGRRNYNFKTETGETVAGTTLYHMHPENGVEGLMADKVGVKEGITIPDVKVGDQIDIRYNRYGKVEAIYKVSK